MKRCEIWEADKYGEEHVRPVTDRLVKDKLWSMKPCLRTTEASRSSVDSSWMLDSEIDSRGAEVFSRKSRRYDIFFCQGPEPWEGRIICRALR